MAIDSQIYIAELGKIIDKIDHNMEKFGLLFPTVSKNGDYLERASTTGSWTGSFWTGMVYLAYKYTGDPKYMDYLYRYLPAYEERLKGEEVDHDLGFLYQLYAVKLYEETGDDRFQALVRRSAELLYGRFNHRGNFIRAWGNLSDDYRKGKMIIDCMMNLPLLYNAASMLGMERYYDAAHRHALSARAYHVRADSSTYHTYDFDPETGVPLKGENEGGYADESAWSRGQAWGIYGFYMSYVHTGEVHFFDTFKRLAAYFIDRLPLDHIPYWDFKLPSFENAVRDSSAAAITASALLDAANVDLLSTNEKAMFRNAATNMLDALVQHESIVGSRREDGLIRRCYIRDKDGSPVHANTIFGDYYYMEALLKAIGRQPRMWETNVVTTARG